MITTKKEAVIEVIALITKGWTRKASARDIHDLVIDPLHEGAVKFCLSGAMQRVRKHSSLTNAEWIGLYNLMASMTPNKFCGVSGCNCNVIFFNDDQKDVAPVLEYLNSVLAEL